jgi:hypothetical protein
LIRTSSISEITAITNLLIIPTVKAAVEALQNADIAARNRFFMLEAELYDDGSPRDLKGFTQEVFGREYFVCVDRIANNGLYIEGSSTPLSGAISERISTSN